MEIRRGASTEGPWEFPGSSDSGNEDWKLASGEPWDHGSLGGRRGEPGGRPAAVEGLGSVRRREVRLELEGWNVQGNDCGKNDKGKQNTRLRLLEKRKIILSI